jgi:hypothetical protein
MAKAVSIGTGDDRTIIFEGVDAAFLDALEWKVYRADNETVSLNWVAYAIAVEGLGKPGSAHVLKIRFKDRGEPMIEDPALVRAHISTGWP